MKYIEQAGSTVLLTVTVRSGSRLVLVLRLRAADEALELIRQHLGRSVVRVGITQFPSGLRIQDASELSAYLVYACENIRIDAALFAKAYRIVDKWYGNEVDEAFEDAIIAEQTGSFEGIEVFRVAGNSDVTARGSNEEASVDTGLESMTRRIDEISIEGPIVQTVLVFKSMYKTYIV